MVTILTSAKSAILFLACAFGVILTYPLYQNIQQQLTGTLYILSTFIYVTVITLLAFYLPIRQLIAQEKTKK